MTWLSASVFLAANMDVFLFRYLAPFLEEAKRGRTVRHFFFIRYSEDGDHVRVRIAPAGSFGRAEFVQHLDRLLGAFHQEMGAQPTDRVVETVYDRSDAYFGETAESVYSELLNECASMLAHTLFTQFAKSRAHLMAGLAAALAFLVEKSNRDARATEAAMDRSRACALEILTTFQWRPETVRPETMEQFRAIVQRILPATSAALGKDRAARRMVRLLVRVRQRGPSGDFVATHSLHLLCNKLGVSPPAEYHIFEVLCAGRPELPRLLHRGGPDSQRPGLPVPGKLH